ncbi:hypothetical protein EV361DRAFT_224671 [Lentinula raphanica]|nr:hypothetical protein EV361DRAFT_224671 [Lentinula raphanica]
MTTPFNTASSGATSFPQLFQSAQGFCIEGGRGPTFNVYPSPETSTPSPIAPSTSNSDRVHDRTSASTPFVESDIYARLLLPRRHGYPLWKPKARNVQLPEVYKKVHTCHHLILEVTRCDAMNSRQHDTNTNTQAKE